MEELEQSGFLLENCLYQLRYQEEVASLQSWKVVDQLQG